jgi:hypothetical protein
MIFEIWYNTVLPIGTYIYLYISQIRNAVNFNKILFLPVLRYGLQCKVHPY